MSTARARSPKASTIAACKVDTLGSMLPYSNGYHYNFPIRSVPRASKPFVRPPSHEERLYRQHHQNLIREDQRLLFAMQRARPAAMRSSPRSALPPVETQRSSHQQRSARCHNESSPRQSAWSPSGLPSPMFEGFSHSVPSSPSTPLMRSIAMTTSSVPMRLTETAIHAAARDSPELVAELQRSRPVSPGSSPRRSSRAPSPPHDTKNSVIHPSHDVLAAAILSAGAHLGSECGLSHCDGSSGFSGCNAAEEALARVEEAVVDASGTRTKTGKPSRAKVEAARVRLAEARSSLLELRGEVSSSLSALKEQMEGDVLAAFAARGIPWPSAAGASR